MFARMGTVGRTLLAALVATGGVGYALAQESGDSTVDVVRVEPVGEPPEQAMSPAEQAKAAVDALKTETDPAKRRALTKEALSIHKADVGHIPLHHQVIPWAMRSNMSVVHRADNRLTAKWVRIN